MEVPFAGKPDPHKWCKHACAKGCSIYADRPQECVDFHCLWLIDERIPDYWKPSYSKMVLNPKLHADRNKGYIAILVDPAYPLRWRDEPWFGDIKKLAQTGIDGLAGQHWSVVVFVGDERIDIRP